MLIRKLIPTMLILALSGPAVAQSVEERLDKIETRLAVIEAKMSIIEDYFSAKAHLAPANALAMTETQARTNFLQTAKKMDQAQLQAVEHLIRNAGTGQLPWNLADQWMFDGSFTPETMKAYKAWRAIKIQ